MKVPPVLVYAKNTAKWRAIRAQVCEQLGLDPSTAGARKFYRLDPCDRTSNGGGCGSTPVVINAESCELIRKMRRPCRLSGAIIQVGAVEESEGGGGDDSAGARVGAGGGELGSDGGDDGSGVGAASAAVAHIFFGDPGKGPELSHHLAMCRGDTVTSVKAAIAGALCIDQSEQVVAIMDTARPQGTFARIPELTAVLLSVPRGCASCDVQEAVYRGNGIRSSFFIVVLLFSFFSLRSFYLFIFLLVFAFVRSFVFTLLFPFLLLLLLPVVSTEHNPLSSFC